MVRPVLLGQLLEHRGVGGGRAGTGLLLDRQSEPVVEDVAQLAGGVDVERPPRQFVDLSLQHSQLFTQSLPQLLQVPAVHSQPGALHPRQYRDQRQFDGGVEIRLSPLGQLGLKAVGEQPDHLDPAAGLLEIEPALESEGSLTSFVDGVDRLDLEAEQPGGQVHQVVGTGRWVEDVGGEGSVELEAIQEDVVSGQGLDERLGVVGPLGTIRVGQGLA
jgi:hypothetical protein